MSENNKPQETPAYAAAPSSRRRGSGVYYGPAPYYGGSSHQQGAPPYYGGVAPYQGAGYGGPGYLYGAPAIAVFFRYHQI